jgi:ADP-ribosylglycohydrolase
VVRRGATCSGAMLKLMSGYSWAESGDRTGRRGNSPPARVHPVAIWFHEQPDRLIEHAVLQGRITHTHPETVASSVLMALLVRWLLLSSGDLDLAFLHGDLEKAISRFDPNFANSLGRVPELLKGPKEVLLEKLRWFTTDDGERHSYGGVQGTALASLLCAVCAFLRSPNDMIESVAFCIEVGGDVDSTASMAGVLSGAYNGVSNLPDGLLERIHDGEYADYSFFRSLFDQFADLAVERGGE